MSSENQQFDPYAAVLVDLKAKRKQIDQAINLIEALRGSGGGLVGGDSQPQKHVASIDDPGAFLGMTIADAAKKLLSARRKTLGNAEIVAAFKAGGLAMNSKDPINTVGSVLTRRFNEVGDIVRVGRGMWGLAEWYPGRNFKKKDVSKGELQEPVPAAAPPQELATSREASDADESDPFADFDKFFDK